jgi:hypothetical protein
MLLDFVKRLKVLAALAGLVVYWCMMRGHTPETTEMVVDDFDSDDPGEDVDE